MTDEEKALEWFRNRRTAVTMKGTREMYDIAIRVLQERVIGAVAGKDFESWERAEADVIGVTVPAIKSRVARLRGCRGKYDKSFFYTPQQDAVIRNMRAQGKSFAEIGSELGKTANAVRKRAKVIM